MKDLIITYNITTDYLLQLNFYLKNNFTNCHSCQLNKKEDFKESTCFLNVPPLKAAGHLITDYISDRLYCQEFFR